MPETHDIRAVFAVKSGKKSPNQETGLENRGYQFYSPNQFLGLGLFLLSQINADSLKSGHFTLSGSACRNITQPFQFHRPCLIVALEQSHLYWTPDSNPIIAYYDFFQEY